MIAAWLHRRLPMIYQRENSECGLACLAMLAAYHGKRLGMQLLRQLSGFIQPRRFGKGPATGR